MGTDTTIGVLGGDPTPKLTGLPDRVAIRQTLDRISSDATAISALADDLVVIADDLVELAGELIDYSDIPIFAIAVDAAPRAGVDTSPSGGILRLDLVVGAAARDVPGLKQAVAPDPSFGSIIGDRAIINRASDSPARGEI